MSKNSKFKYEQHDTPSGEPDWMVGYFWTIQCSPDMYDLWAGEFLDDESMVLEVLVEDNFPKFIVVTLDTCFHDSLRMLAVGGGDDIIGIKMEFLGLEGGESTRQALIKARDSSDRVIQKGSLKLDDKPWWGLEALCECGFNDVTVTCSGEFTKEFSLEYYAKWNSKEKELIMEQVGEVDVGYVSNVEMNDVEVECGDCGDTFEHGSFVHEQASDLANAIDESEFE